jgi:hypothetical protein
MAPVFSPLSGLSPADPAVSGAGAPDVSGALAGLVPLSEGARLKYTVPNPAIAAMSSTIAYLAGDAACLLLFVEFTPSSSICLPELGRS